MHALKKCWLNAGFYSLLMCFTLVAVPLLTLFLVCQTPFVPKRRIMLQLRRCIHWYGYVVIYLLPLPLVRVHFERCAAGQTLEGCIIVCNHRSSSDPFLLAALPLGEGVQVIKAWTLRLPLWGWVAHLGGYLNISNMTSEEFFSRAGQLLREGVAVAAFPEGTRSKGREMGPFHGTVFRLALQERVPIVPVCISGNERIPPRGTMLLNPGRIVLRQLPALMWNEYQCLTPFQLKNKVHELISRELAAMEATA